MQFYAIIFYTMTKKILLLFLTATGLFTLAVKASAADLSEATARQTASQLTSQAEASFLNQNLKPPPLKLEEKPEIETVQEKEALFEEEPPFFTLKKIKLEGSTLFTDKDFEKHTSQFLNRQISFAELQKLAQAITNHYRSQGFITSRAYIPPQTIENDTAVIKIIEGRVGRVRVEGNRYFKSALYENALNVPKDKIFRFQELEASLYFLNQKPDRKARVYLEPGDDSGTSNLILKAEEENPMHIYYDFNNRGTKLTHRGRNGVHFDHTNFLGYGDILNTSVVFAEERAFGAGEASYVFPIDKTGTTLSFGGSYVKSQLIGHVKPFDIEGKTSSISTGATQSFIKRTNFTFDGFLGLDITDSKTTVNDLKTSYDRVRVLKLGPQLALQDEGGRTVLSSYAHWGIPDFLGGLDSSNDPNASRPNAGGEFTYYTGNIARIQRLPWASCLVAKTGGQWTRDTLVSTEQYRLGGAYSVRGYPESDTAGDYGYNFSAELNFPFPFLPKNKSVPFTKKSWYEALRGVAFIDGGKTFIRERTSEDSVKDKFLLGTGFGIRADLDRLFSMQLDLGWPIGDDSSDEKDQWQAHLSLKSGI